MERIYGWFGTTGPRLPGEMEHTFCRTDGNVAGLVSAATAMDWQWDAEQRQVSFLRQSEDACALYYCCRHGRLLFSSHLPWLLAQLKEKDSIIDMNCLADLAIVGFVAPPRAQYRDVFQVPPGAQLQWRPGETVCALTPLNKMPVAPPATGVTLTLLPGKNAPEVTSLSDNLIMYNEIPHCAAMPGESHGDPALLRLSLHMRQQHEEVAHVRFESCEPMAEQNALQRLSIPWLKCRWRHHLQTYWQTIRAPEIAHWFTGTSTLPETEWLTGLIASERQRIVRLMAQAYHLQAEFYYDAREAEQILLVESTDRSFSLIAPETGNLFCHAVILGKSSAKINHCLMLSPKKRWREWSKKGNSQRVRMICAVSSLNYLDGFHYRLPI